MTIRRPDPLPLLCSNHHSGLVIEPALLSDAYWRLATWARRDRRRADQAMGSAARLR